MDVSLAKLISCFCLFFMSVLADQEKCLDARCGEFGPIIRFPFRLKDRQPAFCGYPGFNLSCTSKNELLLELPLPLKFHIESIDYALQQIQVHENNYCAVHKPLLEYLNLSFSPFQYSEHSINDNSRSLLNCSSSIAVGFEYRDDSIPCLSCYNYSICMIPSSYPVKYRQVLSCTKIKDITSVAAETFELMNHLPLIRWHKPDCRHCEAKGKRCGLKEPHETNGETVCFPTVKPRKGNACIAILINFIIFQ